MKTIPILTPMTLGNMRSLGVHTLAVWCGGRGQHYKVLDVSSYGNDMPVPSFGPRIVCTTCGAIGADARPNWQERAPESLFGTGGHFVGSVIRNNTGTVIRGANT
jgi:hypothetical protein